MQGGHHRTVTYYWKEGFYKMDIEALKSRLKKSKLILYRVPVMSRCGRVDRQAYHVWGMEDAGIFFSQRTGAAELRRLARGESGRVCQRVVMIANMLEGMEHEATTIGLAL
jgi:hypothetical protein